MRTAFALTAVLAWVMIQVPVVFCDSGCAEPVSSALAMNSHDCHDEASISHQVRCGHQHGSYPHGGHVQEHPEQPQPPSGDGEHVVVLVQSDVSGTAVALPPHGAQGAALAVALSTQALSTQTLRGLSATASWAELDPPRRQASPVPAADRLQV